MEKKRMKYRNGTRGDDKVSVLLSWASNGAVEHQILAGCRLIAKARENRYVQRPILKTQLHGLG
ncbi:hypothetical protein NQZ68_014813 [Dissostichus eleginoides]|nr:hypothetical protein NQZ68_014813 [Dissostichus eleginoides]